MLGKRGTTFPACREGFEGMGRRSKGERVSEAPPSGKKEKREEGGGLGGGGRWGLGVGGFLF